ncbi:hypothetical protein [Tropicibacter sp. Alg240-R139]|uniref:hypothetical protein n=1 Tax=Tropicibacter sp. Alg240-R139 TaxID=2305991 RepID=UPI001F079373|nr:hypothetical protein [Tropicibacter sp. Alg240-R139]
MLAQASVIDSALSEAELRGKAIFRFVGLPIYEARLFTIDGAPLDWSRDFGIELEYLRKVGKKDLVGSTMDEFARNGPPPPVQDQLARCFDDVSKGDRYLAITQGRNQVGFWRNGVPVCTLRHPQISQRFMSIFVGNNTRSASFTRRLKGE